MTSAQSRIATLKQLLKEKILLLDGGMGTMIQAYKFDEADYRGERFKNHHKDLKGNNDLLTLTQPMPLKKFIKRTLMLGQTLLKPKALMASNKVLITTP